MTVDEIKQRYTMPDILMRYGIQSKGIGRNISCPLHKDVQPSMKIFKDGFKCFSCNENGDIFKFVQLMENCDFKQAYISLGGEYENTKEDFGAKLRLERAMRESEKRIQADLRRKRLKRELSSLISFYNDVCDKYEPLSDMWCKAKDNLFTLMYTWDEKYIKGEEVDISGVVGRYSELKFIGDIIR